MTTREYTDEQLLLPPWMIGTPLEAIWTEAYIDTGDPTLSVEAVRRSPQYDQVFPGNRRDDGSLRYDEATYQGITESFEDSLLSVNVNPDLFRSKFPELVAGLVSPTEFNTRVQTMYENVIEAAPQIRDFYAREYGTDMTDSGIVASFLDPDIGDAIINRRITVAEVGGEAATRGFDIARRAAESLVQAGVGRGEAQQLFGAAAIQLPVLDVLAERHADIDDDFNIEEFTAASIFDDPEQRRRMRRLVAQERSLFGQTGLAFQRDQGLGATGLEQL